MSWGSRSSRLLTCAVLCLLTAAGQTLHSTANIEAKLKEIVALHPDSFDANYSLGEFYLHAGRLADGIPYMEKAASIDPSNYVSGYDLALAYFDAHDYGKARQQIQTLLRERNAAELHSLLADVEEAAGNYVIAADEYQRAAQIEPTEEHIFDWGSELLSHRTTDAAAEVFTRGTELYPRSAKLNVGLGIALYLHGSYEQALRALCAATDLNPSQAWPYVFLGKMYNMSSSGVNEAKKRLARFAQLQPKNPQALYYYAMSLWNREENSEADIPHVQSLLTEAVALDPRYADAHLQLGILYADQRRFAEAIREFQRAIALEPNLTSAHYHLAQAYTRVGEKRRAQEELQIFERLRKQDQLIAEKERSDIKQFIVSMKEQPSDSSRR